MPRSTTQTLCSLMDHAEAAAWPGVCGRDHVPVALYSAGRSGEVTAAVIAASSSGDATDALEAAVDAAARAGAAFAVTQVGAAIVAPRPDDTGGSPDHAARHDAVLLEGRYLGTEQEAAETRILLLERLPDGTIAGLRRLHLDRADP